MHGLVKWFDAEAGYGIIRTDSGVDVLVRKEEIPSNVRTLTSEQVVQFDMLFPAQGAEASIVRKPGATSAMFEGRALSRGWVREFDNHIGRGIINAADGREVSVRRRAIQKPEPVLEVGEEIEFDWVYPTQRIEAINVALLDEELPPPPFVSSEVPDPGMATGGTSNDALRVFLCHSSVDKPRVRQLRQQLAALPVFPWLDEEQLLPGQDWQKEIESALRAAHVVLACLSAASAMRAGFVQREMKLALDIADEQPDRTIFVIPVRFDDCPVPERLRRWQWVDHSDVAAFSRLTAALRRRAQDLGLRWS